LSAALPMLGTNAVVDLVRVTTIGTRNNTGTMDATVTLEFSGKDA